jgi:hypothetical protein
MSYLRVGESMTKNEQALVEWQSFYNHIKHQLSLERTQREDPHKFMDWVKQKYERLYELSPVISQKFINSTKRKIKKNADDRFMVPNYCNGFQHCQPYDENNEEKFEENTVSEINLERV